MSLDRLINLLVIFALIEMMLMTGLRATFAELGQTIQNWRLVARAGVANYLLVPGVAVVLLDFFHATPQAAAGFLLLAVFPGAPFGPPLAGIAGANLPAAVGLMVILAGSSALISPLLLHVLLPRVTGGIAPAIDVFGMVKVLLITQFLPLGVGLLVRHWHPQFADRALHPLILMSKILTLATAGLILGSQWHMLMEIPLRAFSGMLLLVLVCLVIGWATGGSAIDVRRTVALTTTLRNVGIGLVIVTSNFAGTPAVPAALAYGIVEILASLAVAVWWRRMSTQGRLTMSG